MIDIFKDYVLQREELLARIAQELQLDKTRLERMETAYSTVAELLKKDNDFFDDLYSDYKIDRVWASRSINANPEKRGKAQAGDSSL